MHRMFAQFFVESYQSANAEENANKSRDEFRIFCLGGSTVQGRPYANETSFTTWLELSLQAADPRRQWQVVNCGGVSYASYRLLPIMKETLQYEPDLYIIYTGQNEFLEERTYGEIVDAIRKKCDLHGDLYRAAISPFEWKGP